VDEELDDEQQDMEEQQDQEQQEQKERMRIQKIILKNKLRLIKIKCFAQRTKMHLNPREKKTVDKAKKYKEFKNDVDTIQATLLANGIANASKVMSTAPSWYYLGIGALIVVAIICVICIMASVMSWLFPGEDLGFSNEFGIKGKDFYGARVVYKDDELAKQSLVEDYIGLIETGVETAETTVLTNTKLVLNLELPEEEFNYLELSTTYPQIYNTVYEISKIVYKVDNGSQATDFEQSLQGIKYFGLVSVDENNNGVNDITEKVQDLIIANSTFEKLDEGQADLTATDIENAQTTIKTAVGSQLSAEKYFLRTEKLFIKDLIIEEDDKGLSKLEKKNYLAFIFMPKKNVEFSKLSFAIGAENLTNFTITLKNNGSEINLKKDDADYGDETMQSFIYVANSNVNAEVFTDIDTSNLNALSEGMSLFDIVENDLNYSTYLENKTEGTISYLTYKQNGVIVSLHNDQEFNFGEFETTWQTAS